MRATRVTIVIAICFGLAVAISLTWRAPSSVTGIGYQVTSSGPIGPADKDLLYRVKQAGLWEMPLGEEVSEKAMTPRLREIGGFIHNEHQELDDIVNKAAEQLDVELPEQATAEQRAWVAELSGTKEGIEYDRLAVQRLREAHGTVLPLLSQVYVSTRNDTIRKIAAEGMIFVSRHISYLESTGLVNHALLPEPPQPKPLLSPIKESYYNAVDRPTLAFAWIVIALCILGALYITRSLLSKGRK